MIALQNDALLTLSFRMRLAKWNLEVISSCRRQTSRVSSCPQFPCREMWSPWRDPCSQFSRDNDYRSWSPVYLTIFFWKEVSHNDNDMTVAKTWSRVFLLEAFTSKISYWKFIAFSTSVSRKDLHSKESFLHLISFWWDCLALGLLLLIPFWPFSFGKALEKQLCKGRLGKETENETGSSSSSLDCSSQVSFLLQHIFSPHTKSIHVLTLLDAIDTLPSLCLEKLPFCRDRFILDSLPERVCDAVIEYLASEQIKRNFSKREVASTSSSFLWTFV